MTACHTISPAVADDDSFFVEEDEDMADEDDEDDKDEDDEEVGEEDGDLSVINVNRRCELPFVFLQ